MRHGTMCVITLSLGALALSAGDPPPPTPAQKLQQLIDGQQKARQDFSKAYSDAKSDDDRKRVSKEYSGENSPDAYAERVYALAEQNVKDPVALDAFSWLLTYYPYRPEAERAARLVVANWVQNERMAGVCRSMVYRAACPAVTSVLRATIDKSQHRAAQGYARFGLGLALSRQADNMASQPARAREPVEAEAEQLLQHVQDRFADLKDVQTNGTLGEAAAAHLFVLQNLSIGRTVPDLTGQDLAGNPVKLSDSRGKVVLVAFWATWCGPCMADLPAEQALLKRLDGKPFAILGVNADKDREAARKAADKAGVTWPSLWDGASGPVAGKWNVKSWPTLYLIDPNGVIRYKGEHLRSVSVRETKDGKMEQFSYLDVAVDELVAEATAKKP